jgi:hypothetical protein
VTIDQESGLNLENDVDAVEAFLIEHGGRLERDAQVDDGVSDPAVYWLTMRPHSDPGENFVARIEWLAYPYEAPSIKFADRVKGSLTMSSAWPNIVGFRANSFDICRPMCSEGFGIHPEWKEGSTAWPTEGNPFLWVVSEIQFYLDNEYLGRAT